MNGFSVLSPLDKAAGLLDLVTACLSVLACLTQPIGQAAYGSAFQHWAAHPADVLLAAGVLSALVLWLLQTRRTV